jgi:hypothetical protein
MFLRQREALIKSWKGSMDAILIFVCAQLSPSINHALFRSLLRLGYSQPA